MPFIHNYHLMLQHDNARPHVARICAQFLEGLSDAHVIVGGDFNCVLDYFLDRSAKRISNLRLLPRFYIT